MESYAQMDFLNIPVKGLCLEEITGMLPSASVNTSRLVRFNGKPYWSDGTNWIDLSATGTGGSSLQLPQNTKFVSPNFTNVSPFYNTISAAIDNSNNGDYIIVFPGTYTGDFDLSKRHWYFHSNTTISGHTIIEYDYNTSVRGGCVFDGCTSGPALRVSYGSGAILNHVLEFDSAFQGYTELNTWCGIVKCNLIGDSLNIVGSAPDAIYQSGIHISADMIGDIFINSRGSKIYINSNIIGGAVIALAGDTEIEFKRFTSESVNNIVTVAGAGIDDKIAKLKLIDGSFPEGHDGAPPILIGDYTQVDLQHIWVKNAHNEAIFLNGSIRNSHLLKVDNCILIANQAIDATISGQDVYCFGSWGANDVTSNITMRTEALNVGSIW